MPLPVRLYFVDTDQDCHWFLIPEEHREAWDEWSNIDTDDTRSWTPPAFAQALGGHPSCVTFENPEGM